MEILSYGTFTHMKTDKIAQLVESDGRIDLKIRTKQSKIKHLSIIEQDRLQQLEALEKEFKEKYSKEQWLQDNKEAIEDQQKRIERRGVFGSQYRRF